MVGIVGYLLKTSTDENLDLFNYMLNECKPPHTESDAVKIVLTPSSALGIVIPKYKALYDYAYDEQGLEAAIIYGYVICEGRRITAKEIIGMNYDEFVRLLEKADGSFSIVKMEGDKLYIATDWIGTRPIYYTVSNEGIVFSSCLWSILRFFKETNRPLKINDKAVIGY